MRENEEKRSVESYDLHYERQGKHTRIIFTTSHEEKVLEKGKKVKISRGWISVFLQWVVVFCIMTTMTIWEIYRNRKRIAYKLADGEKKISVIGHLIMLELVLDFAVFIITRIFVFLFFQEQSCNHLFSQNMHVRFLFLVFFIYIIYFIIGKNYLQFIVKTRILSFLHLLF